MTATREDTLFILETLGVSKLPYIAHDNDLVFAIDLIAERPDVVPELIPKFAKAARRNLD